MFFFIATSTNSNISLATNTAAQFNQYQYAAPNIQQQQYSNQRSWIEDFSTLPLVYKQVIR